MDRICGKKTILLVEDDLENARGGSLEEFDYKTITAKTSEVALDLFRNNNSIDLVIIDIDSCSYINGPDTAEKILEHRSVPILFLSEDAEPETLKRAGRIQSYGYLEKSTKPAMIDASIRTALSLFKTVTAPVEKCTVHEEILNNSGEIYYKYNLSTGRNEFISRSVFDFTGITPEKCMSMEMPWMMESAHAEDVKHIEKYFNSINPEHKNTSTQEYRLKHVDGEYRWCSDFCSVVPGSSGMPGYITGSIRDINERKIAESSLRQSEGQFRNMFQKHSAVMLLIDPDNGGIVDSNESAVKYYGYDKFTFSTLSIHSINMLPGELVREYYRKAIEEKQSYFEFPHRLANGEIRTVEVHSSPVVYGGKRILFSIIHDITDRKSAEDKIRALLSEKELILQEVHHRMKNFMNNIRGLLLLQSSLRHNTSLSSVLQDVVIRIQSMSLLYDKLFSSNGFIEISVHEYLSTLVDEIIANFPNSNSVRVVKRIDDFVMDVNKMQPLGIIVNELLTNIMKYAFKGRSGGEVEIVSSLTGRTLHLVIRDNGIGIPESISFENSTGFGMQLVSMLARQIGADIRLERNEGTAVILEFNL